ncbi:sodium-coupled monocarboxylate transporter 2-like [Cimex lectularius]|uniref:Sodium/solute symporter n=1 Tax=Cimex lectularius TaxID=79782 RepID=A0A8I6S6S4_CIMLE|nr:sodium-coupled monocarboxylate transporter 2-like [Cimex lectularius]
MEGGKTYMFDWFEYLVFILMLGISGVIGFYYGFIKTSPETVFNYLFGGKKMTTFPIAMSLISSVISGVTLLGVPTEVYVYGTQYMATAISVVASGFITAYIVIPMFFKLQLNSMYMYFELRFSRSVRTLVSLTNVISMICYMPVVIYAPSLAINQVSGINVHIITSCLCLFCIFYTTTGGLRAVVWSDTLQGGLMFLSMMAVVFTGTWKLGGFGHVFKTAFEGDRIEFFNMDLDPTLRISFWSTTIGSTFLTLSIVSINPSTIQRFISLPDMKQAQRSMFLFVLGIITLNSLSGLIGLIIYAYYKDCDPYENKVIQRSDQLLPLFVVEVVGNFKGLPGIFLAGVVSAGLSTFSTGLNTLAGLLSEDFILPWFKLKQDENGSQILKILVIILGAVSLLFILVIEKLGSILETAISFSGMTPGIILGLFILGAFFPTANTKGASCGALASLSLMAWILIGRQLANARGLMHYPKLPVSTDGCLFNTTADSLAKTGIDDYVFPLYKVSFFYYSLIGCTVVLVVGLVVTYLTGPNRIGDVSPKLLSPLIYGCLPDDVKDISVYLQNIERPTNNQ